jgi:hypothetical protein
MPSNDWAYDPLVSEKGVAAVADGCHHVANAAARNTATRRRQGSLIAESVLFPKTDGHTVPRRRVLATSVSVPPEDAANAAQAAFRAGALPPLRRFGLVGVDRTSVTAAVETDRVPVASHFANVFHPVAWQNAAASVA